MGRRTRKTGLPDAWLGEWIGRWVDGESGAQLLRLRLDTGAADSEHPVTGTFDLPHTLRFDAPVRGWWRTSSDVFAERLTLDVNGRIGVASREGDTMLVWLAGRSTRLRRSGPVDAAEFARWVGSYGGGRRRLVLGMITGPGTGPSVGPTTGPTTGPTAGGTAYPFYGEGDALVRLYPDGPGRFLSERGESVVLRDHDRGGGRYLLVRNGVGGRRIELARTPAPVEEQVRFTATLSDGRIELAGTVLRPTGPGPYPAVVLVSGPQTGLGGQRDGLRAIAHRIVDQQVAALIFDPQGHGESGGEGTPTIFETAAAADAAIEHLRTRVDVRTDRIGVWGCGPAMWSLPMVVGYRPDVAFLAGVGTPGVPMAAAETYQRARALTDAGVGSELVERARRAWELIFAVAVAGRAEEEDTAELDVLLKELEAEPSLRNLPMPEYARSEPMLAPVPPRLSASELVHRLSGDPDPELGYDPVSGYRTVRCPVLLQYGAGDPLIPVRESTRRLSEALSAAGNGDVTITVHPDAGSLLEISPADEAARDALHGFRFAPGALDEMAAWISARTR